MRLAQVSDFHFTKLTMNPFRLLSKRSLGHLNWIFRRKDLFSSKPSESLPFLFQALNVDVILLGGDFTSTSMKEEFILAKNFVLSLTRPWIAIPGNHDVYTKRSFIKQTYYQHFQNRTPALYSLAKEGMEAHKIDPLWWVIALDTSRPTNLRSSQGFFSEKLEERLDGLLSVIPDKEKIILFNHYPFFPQEEEKHSLLRGEALEKLIRRHPKIALYLHGHTHRHVVADLQGDELPIILDSGSCGETKRSTCNIIDLNPSGCKVTTFQYYEGMNEEMGLWKEQEKEEFVWKRR